jgi:hypothetical protein
VKTRMRSAAGTHAPFKSVEILQIPVQGPPPNGKKADVSAAWHLVSPAGALPSSPVMAEHVGCPFPRYV